MVNEWLTGRGRSLGDASLPQQGFDTIDQVLNALFGH
jgi:hypothetical protein